jgi:glyoxylase-like metal-dependent hydrolase (beta-lactamase superfamily II)
MALKIFEHMVVGDLSCNCYLIGDPVTRQAMVLDPGDDGGRIEEAIARHALTVTAIVATHAHFDHILAAEVLRASTGAPFYLHLADLDLLQWLPASLQMFLGMQDPPPAPEVDTTLNDGDELNVGHHSLQVIHTPGHSPGSICLLAGTHQDGVLFSGDTLFAMSVGRADLPGGDPDALVSSIRNRLFPLGEMAVYPGHGPATTLDRERVSNPFVGEGSRFWSS